MSHVFGKCIIGFTHDLVSAGLLVTPILQPGESELKLFSFYCLNFSKYLTHNISFSVCCDVSVDVGGSDICFVACAT